MNKIKRLVKRKTLTRKDYFDTYKNDIQGDTEKFVLSPVGAKQISIMIPFIAKDEHLLNNVLLSLEKNCLNPIKKVFLVSPNAESKQQNFATSLNVEHLLDSQLVEITKDQINYIVNGYDRSGWLLQQFIKLSIDKLEGTEDVLVWDADTMLNKPTCFINQNYTQFFFSDEYHLPYFTTLKTLLPKIKPLPVSLVSHHMLLNKTVLKHLKREIERSNHKDWISAILFLMDSKEKSYFSEYELYGNYFFHTQRKKMQFAYWFNEAYPSIEDQHKCSNARFISYHAYLKK